MILITFCTNVEHMYSLPLNEGGVLPEAPFCFDCLERGVYSTMGEYINFRLQELKNQKVVLNFELKRSLLGVRDTYSECSDAFLFKCKTLAKPGTDNNFCGRYFFAFLSL